MAKEPTPEPGSSGAHGGDVSEFLKKVPKLGLNWHKCLRAITQFPGKAELLTWASKSLRL